jgi:hypothetical protein
MNNKKNRKKIKLTNKNIYFLKKKSCINLSSWKDINLEFIPQSTTVLHEYPLCAGYFIMGF